jgi:RNA polymerase sigma factor (sigma-70 family)
LYTRFLAEASFSEYNLGMDWNCELNVAATRWRHAPDEKLFERIWQLLKPNRECRLRRWHGMVGHGGNDTKDLEQELAIYLSHALETWRPSQGRGFGSWCDLLWDRRLSIIWVRMRRMNHNALDGCIPLTHAHLESVPWVDNPVQLIRLHWYRWRLAKLLPDLSPHERHVLRLYRRGMTVPKMSQRLGVTACSVKNAMTEVRGKARVSYAARAG